MKPIAAFFAWIGKFFDVVGLCATVGFIAGALSGLLLMFYAITLKAIPALTAQQVWKVGLLLWAATSLFLLFYLFVLCRYTLASIFFPVVFNCFLTCMLTVWVVDKTGLWLWAFFVGAVIGLLVGRLLCMICHFYSFKTYGVH